MDLLSPCGFNAAGASAAVAFNFRGVIPWILVAERRSASFRLVSFRFASHCLEKVSLPLSLFLRREKGGEGDTRAPRFAGDIAGIMAILIFRAAARFHRGAKTCLLLLLPSSPPANILRGDNAPANPPPPPPFFRLHLLAPPLLFSIDYRPWLFLSLPLESKDFSRFSLFRIFRKGGLSAWRKENLGERKKEGRRGRATAIKYILGWNPYWKKFAYTEYVNWSGEPREKHPNPPRPVFSDACRSPLEKPLTNADERWRGGLRGQEADILRAVARHE